MNNCVILISISTRSNSSHRML